MADAKKSHTSQKKGTAYGKPAGVSGGGATSPQASPAVAPSASIVSAAVPSMNKDVATDAVKPARVAMGQKQHSAVPSRPTYSADMVNPYVPLLATVIEVIVETPTIKTFRLKFNDEQVAADFTFEPGQVGQLSIFGVGESTFVINSPPTCTEYLQFSVMKTGENTVALHGLCAGDVVGIRAPLGNAFPYASLKGKDIVFIGGGIGMAPLRTLLLYMLDNRKDYGKIRLLYGARSPQDMAFSYELADWTSRKDLDCVLTIDREAEGWQHKVGLIPNVLLEMAPSPENCVAITCGPPIMIKFTLQALEKLKFAPEQILTTLERRMKCGVGICGRCNIGGKYVCVDGPVFSLAELKGIPNEL